MTFEVIPGGLLFEDDIPAPEKPYSEWTEEEKTEYHRYLWENAEPGTLEYTIKRLDFPAEKIRTIITVLESIRNAAREDAAAAGYNSEWKNYRVEELLSILTVSQDPGRAGSAPR